MNKLTIAMFCLCMFGAGCTREPNRNEGVVQLEAAVGTIAVSPGAYKEFKEQITAGVNGRTYSKSGETETVTLTGSESNRAVFKTGAAPGTANVVIKGSKRFVDRVVAQAEGITTGAAANLTRSTLQAETRAYAGFMEKDIVALEGQLGETLTSLGRSRSSFNDAVTIKCAFEQGLNGVRLKFTGKDGSLRVTVEGEREFVDDIKAVISRRMNPET